MYTCIYCLDLYLILIACDYDARVRMVSPNNTQVLLTLFSARQAVRRNMVSYSTTALRVNGMVGL